MARLRKTDTVEEGCPLNDHDQTPAPSPSSKPAIEKKIETAAKSEKPRKKKPKASSKSRKSRDSEAEDSCQDTEHESLSNDNSKVAKVSQNMKSSSKSRKSRDSNADPTEECQNEDHDSYFAPKKPTESTLENKPLEASEPEECSNSDHDQPTEDPKPSTTTAKSQNARTIQRFVGVKGGTMVKEVKKSAPDTEKVKASKQKMADKLEKPDSRSWGSPEFSVLHVSRNY